MSEQEPDKDKVKDKDKDKSKDVLDAKLDININDTTGKNKDKETTPASAADPVIMKRLADQEAEIQALKQKNDDQARAAIENDLKSIGLDTEKYKDFSNDQLKAMRTAMVDSDRFQPLDPEKKPDQMATKNAGYYDSGHRNEDGSLGAWIVPP